MNQAREPSTLRTRVASWLGASARSQERPPLPTSLLDEAASIFAASAAEPRIGERLGRFTLLDHIGSGGMATVFRARDEASGEAVALKVVSLADSKRAAALANEAKLLPRARHPNVVALVDSGSGPEWTWLALAMVEGPTLADAAQRDAGQRPCLRTTVEWFRDLARALAALHEAGLLHRDVKPANIVVSSGGKPVLIDFGLATEVSRGQVESWLAGTIPYMSPEQTQAGFSALTERSDIYSLAITIHEAVTCESLLRELDPSDVLQRVAFAEVPLPSRSRAGVPKSLDPIFRRALAKHPRDRYGRAEHLAEDLDLWLQDRPLKYAVETRRTRLLRFVRHHPTTAALVTVIAISVPGYAVVDAIKRSSSHQQVRTHVAQMLESGRMGEAMDAALALHLDGPSAATEDWYRTVVDEAAPKQAERMIECMTFSPDWAYERSRHRSLAESAERHFKHCRHPQLLFQVALGRFLRGAGDEAIAALEAHADLVDRSELLKELRALLFLEAKRFDECWRFGHELMAIAPKDDTVTCLRAYRIAQTHRMVPQHAALEEIASTQALENSRRDLDAVVIRRPPDFLLGRTIRAFLRLESGDVVGAKEDLDTLDRWTNNLDRIAVITWCARSQAEQATGPGTTGWRQTWDVVEKDLDRAAGEDPRFVSWFAEHVSFPTASPNEHRIEWVKRLFGHDWSRAPDGGFQIWTDLCDAVQDLSEASRFDELVEIMRRAECSTIKPREAAAVAQLDLARRCLVWGLVGSKPADPDKLCLDPAEPIRLNRAIAVVDALRTAGRVRWDDDMAEALALARLAKIMTERLAVPMRTRALESLEHVLADERVEQARNLVRENLDITETDRVANLKVIDDLVLRARAVKERL